MCIFTQDFFTRVCGSYPHSRQPVKIYRRVLNALKRLFKHRRQSDPRGFNIRIDCLDDLLLYLGSKLRVVAIFCHVARDLSLGHNSNNTRYSTLCLTACNISARIEAGDRTV